MNDQSVPSVNPAPSDSASRKVKPMRISQSIKLAWVSYFGNWSRYGWLVVGLLAATVCGLLIITAVSYHNEHRYSSPELTDLTALAFSRAVGSDIAKLVLMGLLMPIGAKCIAVTFTLRRVEQEPEFPLASTFALASLWALTSVLFYGTGLFWGYILAFSGWEQLNGVLATVGLLAENVLHTLTILAMCYVVAEDKGAKEGISQAWKCLVEQPAHFLGLTIAGSLLAISGFVVMGLGVFVTLPLGYVVWAISYQELLSKELRTAQSP